jgi:two-component sensor histidine kinase
VLLVTAPEHVVLETDRAITVALLINELITNVAKYAYTDGPCRAWVNVVRLNERLEVTVRDEGVGLPPDFEIGNSKGLGMRLVTSFTKQLNGTIDVRSGMSGTEFSITFPLNQA